MASDEYLRHVLTWIESVLTYQYKYKLFLQNPFENVVCKMSAILFYPFNFRAVYNPEDLEARSNMHLASVAAGVGFGNAGCHLWWVCHVEEP